ncbi:MAG: 23S rRNA (uracil(1939)-C(5))-methyltransferase RlmD [Saprospirales bacterium]|nr:MAG: 23S rRNA (uracil(1939)-C(5))-methyltransferase RlmD [Saprospirales bacterium]
MGKRKKIFPSVLVSDIADKGMAIGRDEKGEVVIVDGAVPGDRVKVLSRRKKKGVAFGHVLEILEYSKYRVEPFCSHFSDCGGCKWQHLAYESQLKFKNQTVINSIKRIAGIEPELIGDPIPAPRTTFFRNKLEFSFSNKRWLTLEEVEQDAKLERGDALGFHRPGSFDKIVDIDFCHLQPEPSNKLRNFIRNYALENHLDFFDIREKSGLLRTMMVRTGVDGQYMVVLSFFRDDREEIKGLLDAVIENFRDISSLYFTINSKANDTILDLPLFLYHGRERIEERIGSIRFEVGPKSFFQTNPGQAEKLFKLALEFADIEKGSLVYDLYCGIGSISLLAAQKAGKVIGIESVPEAIDDAKANARLNGIVNVEFVTAEVEKVLDHSFFSNHGKPSVIIVDPPRAGLHQKVIEAIKYSGVDTWVYVSCNPATQARDIGMVKDVYKLERLQTVDMFPHTSHIETVALLKRI